MGLERPRGSFDVILGQFLHVVVIVFCCFPTFSEVSGWGVGVGGAQFPKSHFSVPKPFQHHNL